MKHNSVAGKYFFGNEISEYGQEHGYVDYRTLAKAFDAVMNNDIISKTMEIGYWDIENGNEAYAEDTDGNVYSYDQVQEKIGELQEKQETLAEDSEEYADIQADIDSLNDTRYYDIFQYFIISDAGARILAEYTDEIVYYNEELDMYVWGVTHCGTSWDYVLTDIRCNAGYDDD